MNPPQIRRRPRKTLKNKMRTPSCIDAVILTVDTARVSGWALGSGGELLDSGELNSTTKAGYTEVGRICGNAKAMAAELKVPAILVLEVPYSQGRTGLGLAKRVDTWTVLWAIAGNHANKVIRKMPAEWRSGLGIAGLKRDAARAAEMRMAQRAVGRLASLGADRAAAVCIWLWAKSAVPVLDLLPASKRKLVGHV